MGNVSLLFLGAVVVLVLVVGGVAIYVPQTSSSGSRNDVIIPGGTAIQVTSSYDCVASHYQVQFGSPGASVLSGAFVARNPGVTLYVATTLQASNLTRGHPSQWVYSTGLLNSTHLGVTLPQGTYVVWIEGADLNCGAKVVMPLEMLTSVNITESFLVTSAPG